MVEAITEQDELDRLREAEGKLQEHTRDLLADWELPLTFSGQHINTGILWINGPFAVDFWSKARKKPKPVKCTCSCGHKHTPPKGKEANHAEG